MFIFDNNLKELLINDVSSSNKKEDNKNEIQKELIYYFLKLNYNEKYNNNNHKNIKFIKYLNNGVFNNINEFNQDNYHNEKTITSGNKTYTKSDLVSNVLYTSTFDRVKISYPLKLIRSLLISAYIYYQNRNSPLMNYINKSNELEIIPFEYNLSEAIIEEKYAKVILSPVRIEPRISKIKLIKNPLKENGFIELSKALIFNKNITIINYSICMIKSRFIYFFNTGLFDSNSVEELNISLNYLNEDCDEYLANILSHLKNLKSINLSFNDLKRGISSFLIVLKNLYREEKTNLETLNLIECQLDDIAFYELGELLKCKYCKLKNLYLSNNNIPYNVNFLKKLKKNKSLTQIYFNKSNIGNNNTEDIMRIISNTNIEELYLYKNNINNIDQCLRIIYRTKLIKIEEDISNKKIYKNESCLFNLNLSNNYCINKNKNKIDLIKSINEDMTLYCLDISCILLGRKADTTTKVKKDYKESINLLKGISEKKEKEYKEAVNNKKMIDIDINKIKGTIKNEELFKDIYISNIINDNKSKFPIFIVESVNKLIRNENKIKNEISNNGKVDIKKYKKIKQDLINYITLQRDLKNKAEYEVIINKKK